MGMFDSFIIQHEGVEREIQTKAFFCVMDRYRVGDVIRGADPGVQIVHDCFYLDRDGKMTWEDEKKDREIHVFMAIRLGIFFDYRLEEDQLTEEDIERRVSTLQLETLTDSARFELTCIESLKHKSEQVRQFSRAIHNIAQSAEAAKKSDEELDAEWFVTEDQKRAQAGELVKVIEEIISELNPDEESWF